MLLTLTDNLLLLALILVNHGASLFRLEFITF